MGSAIVKQRIYGSDLEFLKFIRECPDIPSRIGGSRNSVNDCDTVFHNFMSCVDGQGTREIQTIKIIEVKTRGGRPDGSQKDTFFKLDYFNGQKKVGGNLIRFEGVFFLFMSGTDPKNSDTMFWGVFDESGIIKETKIDYKKFIEIIVGKRHPRSLTGKAYRRHHKTTTIVEHIRAGPETLFPEFVEKRIVTQRS